MTRNLSLVFLAMLSCSAFGQGQVLFNNRNTITTPPIQSPIYWYNVGGPLLSGTDTTLRAALLGGPTNATPAFIYGSLPGNQGGSETAGTLSMLASPATGATWVTFRTGPLAGYVAVGTDNLRDSGLPYGSMGMFQVVAWQGPYNNWASAFAAYQAGGVEAVWLGASNPMILPVTTSTLDANPSPLLGLQSFAITAFIPEPSTFALIGFGAELLFFLRRRKPDRV